MELKPPKALRLELPEDVLKEFFCKELSMSFLPSLPESSFCHDTDKPALVTIALAKALGWTETPDFLSQLEKEGSDIPVLLYAPSFSAGHLLLHYDGSSNSTDLIRKFIAMFGNLIQESKATIISPSFIPKSKIREEQEVIQLVASSISETSFIKFNFTSIGDFWAYAIRHKCTLLVTTKDYQAELAKTLFHFYKGKMRSGFPSIYLSI
jgi:hypothetical protein